MADQDKARKEATERTLAQGREALENSRREAFERLSKGKPTPTQDENDRFAAGEHIMEHEDDGSGPELVPVMTARQMEPRRAPSAAGYSTRAATPAPQRKPE